MSSDTNTTPERYRLEREEWETKSSLYERYWDDFDSTVEIAEDVGVSGPTIRARMREHGIPRRGEEWKRSAGDYDPREDWYVDELDGDQSTDDQPSWASDDRPDLDWTQLED